MSDDLQDLQPWLDAATTALDQALNTVVDLEVGFADAQLLGRSTALTHTLDEVLDLNAGLGQIIPTRHALAEHSEFAAFVDTLSQLPPPERLIARTWLPHRELNTLRSTAEAFAFGRHRTYAYPRDLIFVLVFHFARTLERVLARAHELADEDDIARSVARALALARTLALDLDLAIGLGRGRDRALDRETIRDRDLDLAVTLGRDLALDRELRRGHGREFSRDAVLDRALARGRAHVRDRVREIAFALDPALAGALALTRGFAHTLARDIDRLLESWAAVISLVSRLVTAMGRAEVVITDMTEANLSHLDLSSIPLDGVRWSRRTRWPQAWWEKIRRNSVELEPGLYEIRSGRVEITRTAETSA